MALGDGIRRNIATVSKEERDLFVAAIIELNNTYYPGIKTEFPAGGVSLWFKQDEIHQATHVHGQNHFFPWHRELINRFELLLREINPLLSLHYWDWNQDPTNIPDGDGGFINLFSSEFMGSSAGFAGVPFAPDTSLARPGLYNPTPTGDAFRDDNVHGLTSVPGYALHANPADPPQNLTRSLQVGAPPVGSTWQGEHWSTDSEIINTTDFQELNNWVQGVNGDAHGLAHGWIGGTIQGPHTSFRDPFVFLLHSNLDRLWAMWQRKLPSVRLDPNHVYDPLGADPDLNSPLQPWAGTGDWPTRPWAAPENEQNLPGNNKNSKDISVVIPPSYDTAPHSSYIVNDRDTFSSYEVASTLSYPQAFYVIYDGFTPNELGGGIPAISFLDTPTSPAVGDISAVNTHIDFENAAAVDVPQRISFTFEINFANSNPFSVITGAIETREIILKASLAGQNDLSTIHLIKQPNPYMIDVKVGGSNPTWLSTDVRVFQLKYVPGYDHVAGSTTLLSDVAVNSNAPIDYIQGFLTELRGYGNDSSPFEAISESEEQSQLELSRSVSGVRVFNFAVAKVRYRANSTDATGVRVFFRTFNTMVSALDYNRNTNYRRSASDTIPLLGKIGDEIASIPYFAESRINSASADMSSQSDTNNIVTIQPNPHLGHESVAYFGCWLDFNQTEPQFPLHPTGDGNFASGRLPLLQLVKGIHQCMVAEIRFQPGATDPIATGATPSSSDRLSQRNLSIVESDNPGIASTHVVQHTLLVKPSKVSRQGTRLNNPVVAVGRESYDELVIRWNNLPRETKATFFFPEWDVDQVLLLASTLRQHPNLLKKIDSNTLECTITDISYIPIPGNNVKPFAGLITLQLPQTVRTGQVFKVDVQQHSGLNIEKTIEQPSDRKNKKQQASVYSISKRKVLGAFRITIPVKMGEGLLKREIRNLAVLRYIAQAIPIHDRWYPIFVRYIGQIADKVKGLGVDPALVKASADDPGIPESYHPFKDHCITGKVCEVIFDCFGDFEGFILETCSEKHHFECKEDGIAKIVLIACKERLLISICMEKENKKKICQIIVQN